MNIQKFYNSIGWKKNQKVFEDANYLKIFEKILKSMYQSVEKRILRYIPKKEEHS